MSVTVHAPVTLLASVKVPDVKELLWADGLLL